MREDKQQKQPQKSGKPTISPENHDENIGQRGGVSSPEPPAKDQGDDLEEIIPREPLSVDRPTRDDGDNDDKGAPGSGQK